MANFIFAYSKGTTLSSILDQIKGKISSDIDYQNVQFIYDWLDIDVNIFQMYASYKYEVDNSNYEKEYKKYKSKLVKYNKQITGSKNDKM